MVEVLGSLDPEVLASLERGSLELWSLEDEEEERGSLGSLECDLLL